MKCPKCGKELLKGEVRSRREIEWFDADNKKGIRVSSKLFAISKAEAERCEDCKIEIVRQAKGAYPNGCEARLSKV